MKWITAILCLGMLVVGLASAFGSANSAQVVAVSAVEGEQIRGGQTGCGENVSFTTVYCDGGESYCPGTGYVACPGFPHATLEGFGSGFDTTPADAYCYVCGAQQVECGYVVRDTDIPVCN